MTADDRGRDLADIEVSVIIPAYNAQAELPCQLAALRDQDSDLPYEVIVADNGSTDGTADVTETFAAADPRFRWVDASRGRGPAVARNVGVEAAHGRFLLFCDADDIVTPAFVRLMSDVLRSHEFASGAGSLRAFDGMEGICPASAVLREVERTEPAGVALRFAGLPMAMGCSFGARAETFTAVGGFDESFTRAGEDYELCLRLHEAHASMGHAEQLCIHKRPRSSSSKLMTQQYRWSADGQRVMAAHPIAHPHRLSIQAHVRSVGTSVLGMLCLDESRWGTASAAELRPGKQSRQLRRQNPLPESGLRAQASFSSRTARPENSMTSPGCSWRPRSVTVRPLTLT